MQTFNDLTPTQRTVLRACRNWTAGAAAWAQSDIEIRTLLGPGNGTLAARFLGSFLRLVDTAAVRDLGFGGRQCTKLWPDEWLLLVVLADCQDGGWRHARRRLDTILPTAAVPIAVDYAAAFSATLGMAGLALVPQAEDAETPDAVWTAIAPGVPHEQSRVPSGRRG